MADPQQILAALPQAIVVLLRRQGLTDQEIFERLDDLCVRRFLSDDDELRAENVRIVP